MIEFRMPSLGADMEAGTLREWLVKPGDKVKRGDIIAVVETQKGLIDIEVFESGEIKSLLLKEDDKVPVDTVMALIEPAEKQSGRMQQQDAAGMEEGGMGAAEKKEEIMLKQVPRIEKSIDLPNAGRVKASPLAKRIAEENNIDLSQLKGTGENGVITREDVETAMAQRSTVAKESVSASTESIRMAVAAAMSKSNREIPHYYLEIKADMSKALAWLAEANRQRPVKDRLLPVALLLRAVAKSLVEVPELNAVWDNGLVRKSEINIGFVISLRSGGLMVPAIQQADRKSADEIMQALNDVIPRARHLKLRSSELSNTTITVTSLGEGGAEKVYGVIYPPQVAIVGFGAVTEQPWAENGMLDVRPVLTATLAGDHRATDGHTGSRFLVALNNHLQKPEEL